MFFFFFQWKINFVLRGLRFLPETKCFPLRTIWVFFYASIVYAQKLPKNTCYFERASSFCFAKSQLCCNLFATKTNTSDTNHLRCSESGHSGHSFRVCLPAYYYSTYEMNGPQCPISDETQLKRKRHVFHSR